jgi:hypothetical protein
MDGGGWLWQVTLWYWRIRAEYSNDPYGGGGGGGW